MFENEAFASNSRHEGVAISALISGIDEDSKSDVSWFWCSQAAMSGNECWGNYDFTSMNI